MSFLCFARENRRFMSTEHRHGVCTYAEAEKAIRKHRRIWVNDCFCRGPAKEGKTPWKYCGHRVDTCMGFRKPGKDEKFESREIGGKEALGMFEDWKRQGNLFRFMEDENWLCFCCGCGCGWFRDEKGGRQKDPCGKSAFIEKTDKKKCTSCGKCIDVCAYEARKAGKRGITVQRTACYGCSACEHVCPEGAVTMIKRT